MKNLLCCFLIVFVQSSFAQNAKEIIKKTLDVHLGKNNIWKNIKSVQKKGIIINSSIEDTTFFIDTKTASGKSRLESKNKLKTTIIGFNGSRF